MRRIVTIALVLILVSFLSVISADALFSSDKLDKDDLDIYVRMGYNNKPVEGRWIPVNILIENKTSKNIEGNLVLHLVGQKDMSTSTPVVLPANVTKTTTLYVYYNGHTKYKVSLENNKGKTIYETSYHNVQPTNTAYNNLTYIGVMTDNKDSLNYLMQMEHVPFNQYTSFMGRNSVSSSVRIEALNVNNFPVSKVAIGSFDAIFINEFDLTSLTGEQKETLDYYIKTGGNVIFGTGSASAYAFNGMSEYVSYDVGNLTKENVLLWLTNINKRSYTPKEIELNIVELKDKNLKLLYDVKGVPIAYKHDNYNLYFMTFSLSDHGFTSWAFNYEYMFEFLLINTHVLIGVDDVQYFSVRNNSMTDILGHSSENFLPSILLIVILIGVYMLIVGPVSYAILKKKDKRELMWVVIPIVVVLFSAAIFMYGYLSRGGGNVASTVTIVELNPYSDLQKPAYVATTVLTSSNGDFTFSYSNDGLFGSHFYDIYSDRYLTTEASNSVEFKQDVKSSATIKGATMWSFVSAESIVNVKNYGRIETEFIVRDNGNMILRLKNNTGHDLEKVIVTIYDKVHTIPYFKYLDTVDINYTPVRSMHHNYSDGVQQRVITLFNGNANHGYYGGYGYHISTLIEQLGRDEGVKAALLMKLLSTKLGASEFSMSPQMHIAGFVVNGPEMNLKINGKKPSRAYNSTIVHQSVSLHGYVDLQNEETYQSSFVKDFSFVGEVIDDTVVLNDAQHYAQYEVMVPKEYIKDKDLVLNVKTKENADVVISNYVLDSNNVQYIAKGQSPFKIYMKELSYREYSLKGGYSYTPTQEYAYFLIRIEAQEKDKPLTIESVTYEFEPQK